MLLRINGLCKGVFPIADKKNTFCFALPGMVPGVGLRCGFATGEPDSGVPTPGYRRGKRCSRQVAGSAAKGGRRGVAGRNFRTILQGLRRWFAVFPGAAERSRQFGGNASTPDVRAPEGQAAAGWPNLNKDGGETMQDFRCGGRFAFRPVPDKNIMCEYGCPAHALLGHFFTQHIAARQ